MNGNLVATSGAAITDSAALTVSGTSSFTTDVANNSITSGHECINGRGEFHDNRHG